MQLIIINGPNLNLLGKREPEIYGSSSFEDYYQTLKKDFTKIDLHYFQSNHEGEIVDKIHEVGFSFDGIIINGAGYSHTSVAIADALAAVNTPAVEVHISNVYQREEFRHHSHLTKNCIGIISGLGLEGYRYGIDFFTKNKK